MKRIVFISIGGKKKNLSGKGALKRGKRQVLQKKRQATGGKGITSRTKKSLKNKDKNENTQESELETSKRKENIYCNRETSSKKGRRQKSEESVAAHCAKDLNESNVNNNNANTHKSKTKLIKFELSRKMAEDELLSQKDMRP